MMEIVPKRNSTAKPSASQLRIGKETFAFKASAIAGRFTIEQLPI